MRILGISAFYHDSAAVLLEDGRVVAAVQEERFSRIKHDPAFPRAALAWCLRQSPGPVDAVVYYEKPLLKFERILSTALSIAPRGFRAFATALPVWLRERLWLPAVIEEEFARLQQPCPPVRFAGHHEAHAASAFFPSPFSRAAVLSLDGVGEWATTTLGHGRGSGLELLAELRFPHSSGLLYSAFTYHAGFRVNSGEYKLMGLAPYGEPRFVTAILDHLLDLKPDGSFRLNLEFFDFLAGQRMTSRRFEQVFGSRRDPEGPLTQQHCDLACSIQQVTEEIVLRLARGLHDRTGEAALCLAGGVALNCVANARLAREGPFRQVWVQPAAGDAGGALGAALAYYFGQDGVAREADEVHDAMAGALLGPDYGPDEIASALREHGLEGARLEPAAWAAQVARRLAAGQVVGFFAGRAEFGPRALGARSILADARDPEMQRRLNLKIKFRESFRPFAPVVLAERAAEYFDLATRSPYMLFTAPVALRQRCGVAAATEWEQRLQQVRSTIPAVTHVDFSARVQTVERALHPHLHAVLTAFAELTGCPVLINTSFNVRGEPPVGGPREAIEGFLRTDMDALAIGPYLLDKAALPAGRRAPPAVAFAPD